MKVISGFLRGREIKGYTIDGTRPTMDRVKESMFASIQNYIESSTALDLFSGTGSLGIEAISNGAKKVYFNDRNKVAVKMIKDNLEKFGISDKADVIKMDYIDAIEYYKENRIKFNIILLDPPYDNHVITQILKLIYRKKLLRKGGIVICEYQNEDISTEYFTVERQRVYGYRKVSIYTEKK